LVDRETVVRILTMSEMEACRGQARSIILQAVPDLATLLVQIANTKDLAAILAALRGVGALTNKLEVESTTKIQSRKTNLSGNPNLPGTLKRFCGQVYALAAGQHEIPQFENR
jgi:flagellar basal body P-ring protein FlgI